MTRKEFKSVFKRFFITFLICLPIFIVIGVFLTDLIGNVWTIVIYVAIGLLAFFVEELWWKKYSVKKEAKRQELLKLRKEKKRMKAQYEKMNKGEKNENGK